MNYVTTKDGVEIFYKDWGPKGAQPVMFHHGWPLASDDWDNQMLFFLQHGYRVVAHDRRGHGRSSQVSDDHDMDHYAADASAVAEHLDLRNVPTLVLHGDDDQVVPIDDAGRLSVKLLKNGNLKVYPGFPHGILTVHADVINPDLLAFVKG